MAASTMRASAISDFPNEHEKGRAEADIAGPGGSVADRDLCPPGSTDAHHSARGMDAGEGSPLHKDIERTPLRRLAEVDEIADAIVWLSSPMNSFAQGSALVVDGGFTSN